MSARRSPPTALLNRFAVSDPTHVAQTDIATVWKVRRNTGQPAALKLYHDGDMRNEAAGFDFLQGCAGNGAAAVYDRYAAAALIEWLEGPSLGDLTRQGSDTEAGLRLVQVAVCLQMAKHGNPARFPVISDWLRDLFDIQLGPDCQPSTRQDIARCQAIARDLLATMQEARPLHGDLHHDNVRGGPRGDCAFDAKGVLGDPAYELANAFRNPKGADDLVRDPGRIRTMADLWSDRLGVERRRLLNWAAVKCALSIAWRSTGALSTDPELDLLSILLHIAETDTH